MNEIEITLKGEMALAYINNENVKQADVLLLSDKIEDLECKLQEVEDRAMHYYELYTGSNNTPEVPNHLKEQLDKHKAVKEESRLGKRCKPLPNSDITKILANDEVCKPKYKSRLAKQDRLDLDEYASEKVRSNCKLSQFAMKRNLREVTVITYINKHSDNKYKLVKGKDIPKWDRWANASIVDDELYIRLS